MELEGTHLKIKRGSLLPIDVKKSDSHVAVRDSGVTKQLAHNKQLRDDEDNNWVLLYPDMDNVLCLPGTKELFSVEKYKESLGRPYSRVNLHICKMVDYESRNCTFYFSKLFLICSVHITTGFTVSKIVLILKLTLLNIISSKYLFKS